MILAVFSDTHGNTAGMVRAVRRTRPDVLVHLGDHIRDTAVVAREFPELPLYAVSGNCDYTSKEPDTITFLAGTVTVFATHGHRYSVKYGLDELCSAARSAGTGLALYGHTHIARFETAAGLLLLNPGTAGMGTAPTFAVVEIDGGGGIICRILNI